AREFDGGVAEAAADVEHAIALGDLELREHGRAVMGESVHDHVPEADELGNEDLVPEVDVLRGLVRYRLRRRCRHLAASRRRCASTNRGAWPRRAIASVRCAAGTGWVPAGSGDS